MWSKSNPELMKKEGPMLHVPTQSQHRLAMIKHSQGTSWDTGDSIDSVAQAHNKRGGGEQVSCKKKKPLPHTNLFSSEFYKLKSNHGKSTKQKMAVMNKYMNMLLKWTENSQKIPNTKTHIYIVLLSRKKSYIWSFQFQITSDKNIELRVKISL